MYGSVAHDAAKRRADGAGRFPNDVKYRSIYPWGDPLLRVARMYDCTCVLAALPEVGVPGSGNVQPYYPKWAFLNANATLSGPATWHLFADDRVVRPGDGLGSAACLAATPRSPLGASAARSRALERCRRCKQTLGQAAEADRCAARAGRATAPLWRRAASVRLLMP